MGRVGAVLILLLFASVAQARPLWESEDLSRELRLDTSLKSSWLLSRTAIDPRSTFGTNLWRLRLDLSARPAEWIDTRVAYEHRTLLSSEPIGTATGGGILLPDARAPYRVEPISDDLIDGPNMTHLHELDRLFVALHSERAELTVGRQAIGYGRGTVFSAVDLFAPFGSLEVDREFRRGVDAAHGEVQLNDHTSVDLAAVPDARFSDYAMVGRLRGYAGDADGSLIVAKRNEDVMYGTTASLQLLEAEMHGEFAVYDTDGTGLDGGWADTASVAAKYLLGVSYVFDVGNGLSLLGEYHYNGFGVPDVTQDPSLLLDPDWLRRLGRGDFQTLGRHAIASVLSYAWSEEIGTTVTAIASPVDGSGIGSLGVQWTLSENTALAASGFVPWGERPAGIAPRSEYGLSPISAFVQLSATD